MNNKETYCDKVLALVKECEKDLVKLFNSKGVTSLSIGEAAEENVVGFCPAHYYVGSNCELVEDNVSDVTIDENGIIYLGLECDYGYLGTINVSDCDFPTDIFAVYDICKELLK